MLAVRSAMDAMRHAGPQGSSERHILLREPSAEDLDAAHQLVSSARAERKNPLSVVDSHASDPRDVSSRQQATSTPGTDPDRAMSESQDRDVAGSFSQVCRYVDLLPRSKRNSRTYIMSISTSSWTLTDIPTAIVGQPRLHFGGGHPQAALSAMLVGCTRRRETPLDQLTSSEPAQVRLERVLDSGAVHLHQPQSPHQRLAGQVVFPTGRPSIHPDLAQVVGCATEQAALRAVEDAQRSTTGWRGRVIRFPRRDTIEPPAR